MKTNTSKLTFSAVLAAVSVAVLYIATAVGTLQLAAVVLSTLAVMLTTKICGRKFAFAHYGAVAALLFILLPNKFYAAGYTLFFGLYAIVKSFIEQKNNIKIEWILKIICFAVISAVFLIGFYIFAAESQKITGYVYIALFFGEILIMVLYDVFLSIFGNQFFVMAEKYLKNLK